MTDAATTPKAALGTEGFTRRKVDVRGVKTVYYEAGEGPTVVYFHGGGTFHGIQFAKPWTDKFRVILPYHPGFGESNDDPRIGAMQHLVLHYLDFFETLGLDKVHLIGASLGGRLATEFAVSHNDRLKSLILAAPGGLEIPEHPPANFAGMSPEEMFITLSANQAFLAPFLPPAVPPELFFAQRAREGQASAKAMTSETNLEHWMHRISVPCLLLWGKEDKVLPVGRVKAWTDRLPKATTLRIFKDVGHLTMDESPEAVQVALNFMLSVEQKLMP
ncbi:MAG TPA: alpha/beta hydrolase [Caulobacteraceae bacterium]